jgi:hypothetical protein
MVVAMSLAAEALLAVTGIFPDEPISPADARLAVAIPKTWRAEAIEWIDQGKSKRFRLPKAPKHAKIRESLVQGLDSDVVATVTSSVADASLIFDYQAALSNAREYLRAQWPMIQREVAAGPPKLVEPGRVEQGRAASLLAVVDEPDRVLEEMRMGTLTAAQADAFRACYPSLAEMLHAIIDEELRTRRVRDDDYELHSSKVRVYRHLIGLPQEAPFKFAETPPAQMAKPSISVALKPEKLMSKAQELQSR